MLAHLPTTHVRHDGGTTTKEQPVCACRTNPRTQVITKCDRASHHREVPFGFTVRRVVRDYGLVRAVLMTPAPAAPPKAHFHVTYDGQDCDGRITREYVTDEHPDVEGYTLQDMDVDTASWHQPTEEGYRSLEITRCTDASCDLDARSYRDHRAEAAGY